MDKKTLGTLFKLLVLKARNVWHILRSRTSWRNRVDAGQLDTTELTLDILTRLTWS